MKGLLIRLGSRLLGALITVWVVATFTFFLVRLIPGDPAAAELDTLLQQGVPDEQAKAQVASMYGFLPKDPIPVQYVHYIGRLAHFDLGQSISYSGVPVSHIIWAALPYTLGLVSIGIVVTFFVGIIGGVFAAIKRDSWVGSSITLVGSILHGLPQFMVALLLAYFFATRYPIFPFGAPYDAEISPGVTWQFLSNVGVHAVLPIAAFVISGFGFWALAMKGSVVSTMGDDFILASELRGIKPSIRFRYVARNAFLPLFTVLAISVGYTFGGAIFIEKIFDYPGLGLLLNNSLGTHDFPLMQAAFLMITVGVIVANFAAELLYSVIDPRIRTSR